MIFHLTVDGHATIKWLPFRPSHVSCIFTFDGIVLLVFLFFIIVTIFSLVFEKKTESILYNIENATENR